MINDSSPNNCLQIDDDPKKYEEITKQRYVNYKNVVASIDIVKQFIKDRNLLIYGGTAIDYNLRLKGDKIYTDENLAIPDLDFFSPDNVKDTYDLVELLKNAGYTEARCIVALHVTTMRVDIMDNNWVADISYVPRELFEKLPYLNYEGMRIIHPDFQRIDVHQSLSFPFANVPKEAIFRWKKDIDRFNKLNKHYPLEIGEKKGNISSLQIISVDKKYLKYVINGFFAYAILYDSLKKITELAKINIPADIIVSELLIESNKIRFKSVDSRIDLISISPDKIATELKLQNVREYAPYGGIKRKKIMGNAETNVITIENNEHDPISINYIIIDGVQTTVVNIQYLLKYFCAEGFMASGSKRDLFYLMYNSVLSIIQMAEEAVQKLQKTKNSNIDKLIESSPFFPSIQTYGEENIPESYDRIINMSKYNLPKGYKSDKSRPPPYDYNEKFFIIDGRELKK